MWPFSKNKESDAAAQPADDVAAAAPEAQATSEPLDNAAAVSAVQGPFDGDTVDFDSIDFSDFSDGALDLGSVKIPMPRPSEVQVEMGPDGPRMVHIVTKVGRLTPVAFASTSSGGLWRESVPDIVTGMEKDGLSVSTEAGPWGEEIVGATEHATIRMIGVEGPRWTLRVTLASPSELAEQLAELGREVIARTFVYRGDGPMMAGTVLPVVMPAPLVEQVQQAMQERAAQAAMEQAQAEAETAGSDAQPQQVATPLQSHQAENSARPDAGSALQQMQAQRDAETR